MRNLKEAVDLILGAESICVACHENPDGDAIGCLVALGEALSQLSKKFSLFSPDGVPSHLFFLVEGMEINTSLPEDDYSLWVLVDAASPHRLGKRIDISGKEILIIDHHPPTIRKTGVKKLIDKRASATAEIVYKLLKHLPVKFNQRIIDALLSAILADTGGLRFSNTSPKTLNLVARLMRAGGDLERIYRKLYEERSEGYLKILGEVLLRANTNYNGKILISYVLDEDKKKYNISDTELEGLVDYLRLLKGWEVVCLLREKNGEVRVSIRARSFDAGEFARAFGGGGHKEAAGFTLRKSIEETKSILVRELQKWMES